MNLSSSAALLNTSSTASLHIFSTSLLLLAYSTRRPATMAIVLIFPWPKRRGPAASERVFVPVPGGAGTSILTHGLGVGDQGVGRGPIVVPVGEPQARQGEVVHPVGTARRVGGGDPTEFVTEIQFPIEP